MGEVRVERRNQCWLLAVPRSPHCELQHPRRCRGDWSAAGPAVAVVAPDKPPVVLLASPTEAGTAAYSATACLGDKERNTFVAGFGIAASVGRAFAVCLSGYGCNSAAALGAMFVQAKVPSLVESGYGV